MLKRTLRFFSSLELSPTFPPRLQINLPSHVHEFILDPNKSVADLLNEIKQEDSSVSKVSLTLQGKEADPKLKLGEITKNPFHIIVNQQKYHVYPGLAQLIRGNEAYLSMCKEAGISFNDGRVISHYIERLTKSLPDKFDYNQLQSAALSSMEADPSSKSIDIQILNSQIQSLQVELEPLEQKLNEITRKSKRYASLVINGGLAILLTQWSVIAYGTFALYGWDTMEPVSYVVGSTWALLGYIFFMQNRTEFEVTSFRNMLIKKKFDKLVQQERLDLKRIEILKRSIASINQQIQVLSS